jgi:hypothetical protein
MAWDVVVLNGNIEVEGTSDGGSEGVGSEERKLYANTCAYRLGRRCGRIYGKTFARDWRFGCGFGVVWEGRVRG